MWLGERVIRPRVGPGPAPARFAKDILIPCFWRQLTSGGSPWIGLRRSLIVVMSGLSPKCEFVALSSVYDDEEKLRRTRPDDAGLQTREYRA
jgi:hypothetical protein